jgi:hypothetical protein
MLKKQLFKLSIIASALALSACGGSNSSSKKEEPPIVNELPTVSIENIRVDEHTSVSVTAIAADSDGSISSYSWSQTSGTTVELSNADTASVTFTTPEVTANEDISLSLIVTDNEGGTATATSTVSVNQLTIPLTLSGLATDSPISNAQISVQVAGHDVTVDVTADDNGMYSVDLLLDDSEADAFISIIAKGVSEQANAGLISLLGTAGQLSAMAADDNTLTEDEGFAVNVTNITTAQYALIKLANNGVDISNDAEFEALSQSLDYAEVIALATAIKVAIDKAMNNPDLALPNGITDTLALVENIDTAQAYVQAVQDEPEYQEAQEEIYQDENLIDTSSEWNLPDAYYFLPQRKLSSGFTLSGFTFRFEGNDGDTRQGDTQGNHFTWEIVDGVVNALVTDSKISYVSVSREINGENTWLQTETSNVSYELKRFSSRDDSDVILVTTTILTHFPNGEFEDETHTRSETSTGIRNTATVAIDHTGAGIAYLPFVNNNPDDSSFISSSADEFILNSDGTGHAAIQDFDFTWKINEGVFELIPPSDNVDEVYVAVWKQLNSGLASNTFVYEFTDNGEINDDNDYINPGAILTTPMNWQPSMVAGIYTYDNATFTDPLDNFWFELRENGEADTVYSFDYNEDGVITEDELDVMRGSWTLNGYGTLVITRVRHQYDGYTAECRYASTEGCVLYHERTWRLIGQKSNAFTLFHKHDFKFTNLDSGFDNDEISYSNLTLYKVDSPPVQVSSRAAPVNSKEKVKIVKERIRSKKFSILEPANK